MRNDGQTDRSQQLLQFGSIHERGQIQARLGNGQKDVTPRAQEMVKAAQHITSGGRRCDTIQNHGADNHVVGGGGSIRILIVLLRLWQWHLQKIGFLNSFVGGMQINGSDAQRILCLFRAISVVFFRGGGIEEFRIDGPNFQQLCRASLGTLSLFVFSKLLCFFFSVICVVIIHCLYNSVDPPIAGQVSQHPFARRMKGRADLTRSLVFPASSQLLNERIIVSLHLWILVGRIPLPSVLVKQCGDLASSFARPGSRGRSQWNSRRRR